MTPGELYAARLAEREARIAVLQRSGARFGAARLVVAAVILLAAWMVWFAHWFPSAWLALPIAAFAALLGAHSRQRRELMRTLRAAAFYRRAIARLEDRWAGTGIQEHPREDAHHPYAADLDVFGAGSLFELLCTARTAMGRETLADWLLGAPHVEQIRHRHECIDDLRARVELREALAVLGEPEESPVSAQRLLAWSRAPNGLVSRWIGALAVGLPTLLMAALLWGFVRDQWLPALSVVVSEAAALYSLRRTLAPNLTAVASVYDSDGLRTVAQLLERIEHEPFGTAALHSLTEPFVRTAVHSSSALARLAWIAAFAEAREALTVRWLLTVPLLYPLQVALAAERWRGEHGAHVPGWIDAIGRFEALTCLAQFAFEHPQFPNPQFCTDAGVFEAHALGHPLLPASRCVRNDVSLSSAAPVLLVSGSNMSGKSTLLRAVGLNVVLAMAAAPVNARSLRLSPLAIGASIRVNDSVQEGQSRFCAELTRLRQIVAIAESGTPLLFLIDELLQGTNSKDRRIGAQGLLRTLIDLKAIGIATTHDLALTELPGIAPSMRNVHLRETMRDGIMHFDYTLRPGVVTSSNGVELMRAMGLRV
ncbi:MAG: MutS-related protein [Steroidobacteraceae bacterium]